MLSALLLLLAMALAGGYEPLSAPAQQANAQSGTDGGAVGHRSTRSISKQQLYASEAEDKKAAAWHEGEPKAFLPSQGIGLSAATAGVVRVLGAADAAIFSAASPFDARAPPAHS